MNRPSRQHLLVFGGFMLGAARAAAASILMCLATPIFAAGAADADDAVSSGASALNSWWNYPWYDSQSDDIRRIDLKTKSPQPPPRQSSGGNYGGTWDLEWLGWLLIILLAATVLFIALRVFLNRDRRASGAAKPDLVGRTATVDRLEELPFELELPADDLLTAARRAADQGNFDKAIILLYSHQLLELDRRDAIRLTKGKTNRQYLRELGRGGGAAALLSTSMVAFEDVFFGGHSLTKDRFEVCWDHALELLAAYEMREAA
jgi:hypothetical protein